MVTTPVAFKRHGEEVTIKVEVPVHKKWWPHFVDHDGPTSVGFRASNVLERPPPCEMLGARSESTSLGASRLGAGVVGRIQLESLVLAIGLAAGAPWKSGPGTRVARSTRCQSIAASAGANAELLGQSVPEYQPPSPPWDDTWGAVTAKEADAAPEASSGEEAGAGAGEGRGSRGGGEIHGQGGKGQDRHHCRVCRDCRSMR